MPLEVELSTKKAPAPKPNNSNRNAWIIFGVLAALILVIAFANNSSGGIFGTASICTDKGLHDAIDSAGSGSTINFGTSCTVYLSSPLVVTRTLTLNGNGNTVSLDGQGQVQVLSICPTSCAKNPISFTLENITITHGSAGRLASGAGLINNGATVTITNGHFADNTGYTGGGINNTAGTLAISQSHFTNNSATYEGTAVYTQSGNVTITGSTFAGNGNGAPASGSSAGAAVYVGSGKLEVDSSTFSGNGNGASSGGGLYLLGGTATVTGSTFANNSALRGGAILNANATLTISGDVFTSNAAPSPNGSGGAIDNEFGIVAIDTSSFRGNLGGEGGAIAIQGGTTKITTSDLISNSATNTPLNSGLASATSNGDGGGGAIYLHGGAVTLSNSTLWQNSALGYGGGAIEDNGGSVTLLQTTIVQNKAALGGGLAIYTSEAGTAALTIGGTIVSSNALLSGQVSNCLYVPDGMHPAALHEIGYNLESQADCAFTGIGSIQNADPLLDTTALAVGAHAPLPNSPAIDKIPLNAGHGLCPATDEAGGPRPDADNPAETACDIGAIETNYLR